MNWGDDCCGVKVTPESWDMGVIQFRNDGSWEYGPSYSDLQKLYTNGLYELTVKLARAYTPIFPPRGWAGKSDAELWAEIAGGRENSMMYMGEYGRWSFFAKRDGAIWELGQLAAVGIGEYPDIILALQNAQVLASRLAEAVQP